MVAPWSLLLVNLITGYRDGSLIQRDPRASLGFPPRIRRTRPAALQPSSSCCSWTFLRYKFPLQSDRLGLDEKVKEEETLLCVNLSVNPGVMTDEALAAVSQFCQSFPFAAVLPVQPLHYLPLDETGVEVKFLRKKTDLKSGVDGGIRFFVQVKEYDDTATATATEDDLEVPASPGPSFDDDNDEEESSGKTVAWEETRSNNVIEITAKRNSQGQVITKLMSEKIVVTRFVAELQDQQLSAAWINNNNNDDKSTMRRPLQDVVTLTSVFHKWM
jgi:hypothetical protein